MTILTSAGVQNRSPIEDGLHRDLFERLDEGLFIGEVIRDFSGRALDFRFLDYNQAFARHIGTSRDINGLRVTEVIPGFPTDVIGSCGMALELKLPITREVQLSTLSHRWYGMRIYPMGERQFMALCFDISANKRTERRLKESEALLIDVIETMDQLVWSARPDGYRDFFNRRWYEFTGKRPGSTRDEEWVELYHPDDRDRTLALWRNSLETGLPYEVEHRLYHHSKGWRWVLERAHPVRDKEGETLRWMGTCTDIQHQKELAEELALATDELSHRIKNIFAVVSALITLSLRDHPAAASYGDGLRHRIEALGRAHHYARPYAKTSLPSHPPTILGLVRQLLDPYEIKGRNEVVISGDNALLDRNASTPLSLALHELATNAAKYGALSAEGGQLEITATLKGDIYELSWIERGGPVVEQPEQFGFGSRLVEVSLQNRLNGSLQREWRPEGLIVRLVAPAKTIIGDS